MITLGRYSDNKSVVRKTISTTRKSVVSKADHVLKDNGCAHIIERGPNSGQYCNTTVASGRKYCNRHKDDEDRVLMVGENKESSQDNKVPGKRGRKKANPVEETSNPDLSVLPGAKTNIEVTGGGVYLDDYDPERNLFIYRENNLIIHRQNHKMIAVAELDDKGDPKPISSKNETIASSFGLGQFNDFFGDAPQEDSQENDNEKKEEAEDVVKNTDVVNNKNKINNCPNIASADLGEGMVAINNMSSVVKAIENSQQKVIARNSTSKTAATGRRRKIHQ